MSLFCLQYVYIIMNQIYKIIYEGETMFKKTVMLTVTVLICLSAFIMLVNADSNESTPLYVITEGTCGPNATYNLYIDGTLEITGSGEMYQYDVSKAPWCVGRDIITKIIIGDKITKLGASAFIDCKNVTELTIPITLNTVFSDKYPAFAGCCNLKKVTFTSGMGGYGYNYAANTGSNSWYQNTPWYQSRESLWDVELTDGIKGIGSEAFRDLLIYFVTIPDSVVHLGDYCFRGCWRLREMTIPISLNSYGNEKCPAFCGCGGISKVTFSKGNGIPFDYYDWKFDPKNLDLVPWNMNGFTKMIVINDDVQKLGGCMFWDTGIYDLTIPISIELAVDHHGPFRNSETESVYGHLGRLTLTKGTTGRSPDYAISADTAKYCPWNVSDFVREHYGKYMYVTVEEGVTHIGKYLFSKCNMLGLVLPSTLTSFGNPAFHDCAIIQMTIPISLNATWLDEGFRAHPAFERLTVLRDITFTPGSGYGFDYAAYKGSNCWYQHTPWYQCRDSLKWINFSEGIKHIGSDAFRDLHVTSLTIPRSVESLGCHAFYNMKELSSLTIPITLDSVGSTKYPAFDQDYNITELTFTPGNAIGHNYTDCVPFWNYSRNKGFTVTFDQWIIHIGDNTLSAFKFADANGQPLEPTAANLSGHTFRGADSEWLYLVEESKD